MTVHGSTVLPELGLINCYGSFPHNQQMLLKGLLLVRGWYKRESLLVLLQVTQLLC